MRPDRPAARNDRSGRSPAGSQVDSTVASLTSRASNAEGTGVRHELNVLALVKGEERYVFVYDDDSGDDLLDAFRQFAADPRYNFSWFDAAVLADKAREQIQTPPVRTNRISSRIGER